MKTYRTAQVATLIGLHPNTIRRYEEWELIPAPERLANGYRVYTEFHVDLIKMSRKAFQIELLHANLRRTMIDVIKASAEKDFKVAQEQLLNYLRILQSEQIKAKQAARISYELLFKQQESTNDVKYSRKQVAQTLKISVDSLRNWELNGLLSPIKEDNGYRFYHAQDLNIIKVIQVLRDAKYSLEAILRMLNELNENPGLSISDTLNTPAQEAEIISVCDKLLTSLSQGEANAREIEEMIRHLAERYGDNS